MGGGLGNAVLFSIGQELIKNNSNVLYFAGYKQHTDVFCENILKMPLIQWFGALMTIQKLKKQEIMIYHLLVIF